MFQYICNKELSRQQTSIPVFIKKSFQIKKMLWRWEWISIFVSTGFYDTTQDADPTSCTISFLSLSYKDQKTQMKMKSETFSPFLFVGNITLKRALKIVYIKKYFII